jgi:hypothetical protein
VKNVTEAALVSRINRRLSREDEQLHKSRGVRCALQLGEYYVRNSRMNLLVVSDVDPEQLGRQLGVLKHYEQVI